MKKRWLWALTLLLVIPVVFFSGCSCTRVELGDVPASLRVNLEGGQQSGIWVSGEGEVTAVPDIATLRLGIEAQEATVDEAQARAAEAMDGVMSALKDNGVAEKDIQTQYFSVNKVTRWDREEDEEVILGYRVTNIVTAKIRERWGRVGQANLYLGEHLYAIPYLPKGYGRRSNACAGSSATRDANHPWGDGD